MTDEYVGWMNDPEVTRYLETKQATPTSLRAFFHQSVAEGAMLCAIMVGEKRIGNIKLAIDRTHWRGEIGLFIGDRASWGKGYGTEAIERITSHALRIGLWHVEAGCYATNVASLRAFAKAGYREVGRIEGRWWSEGRYVDHVWLRWSP